MENVKKQFSTLNPATRKWAENILDEFELESHHIKLLTLAGQAWDTAQEMREAIKKIGIVYNDRWGQPHARPEVGIERDSRLAFARILRELNLDSTEPEDSRPPALKYQL